MPALYAGLDVSQAFTSICVVDAKGQTVLETKVETSPQAIALALKPYRRLLTVVGHEPAPGAAFLHREFLKRRLPAKCFDARRLRAALVAQRNKTDRNDARDFAILLSRGYDAPAYVRSIEAHRIRFLLTLRRTLRRKTNDVEAAMRTSVKMFGAELEIRKEQCRLKEAPGRRDSFVTDLVAIGAKARADVRARLKELDTMIDDLAERDPVCKRLMTAPGVGPITALQFKAAIDDPERFASSRLVGAYLGLTPRSKQSGESSVRGHISRWGDRETRAILYHAASVILNHVTKDSHLRTWGLKMVERRGFRLAAVACARRLAVVLHRMWVTNTDFVPFPEGDKSTPLKRDRKLRRKSTALLSEAANAATGRVYD